MPTIAWPWSTLRVRSRGPLPAIMRASAPPRQPAGRRVLQIGAPGGGCSIFRGGRAARPVASLEGGRRHAMTRPQFLRWCLATTVALAVVAPAAFAAPDRASSRMRALPARMTVQVRAEAADAVLDSLVNASYARGYALVYRDPARMRVRMEKPAMLGEVGALGWKYEDTERRWLDFE